MPEGLLCLATGCDEWRGSSPEDRLAHAEEHVLAGTAAKIVEAYVTEGA